MTKVPGGYVYGRQMHALTLGPNHALEFYEFAPGEYGVRELLTIEEQGASILDQFDGEVSLVDVYRLAVNADSDDQVPTDVLEADRVMAEQAARAPEPNPDEELPELAPSEQEAEGLVDKARQRPVVPPPGNNCSADLFRDGWGGQWALNNFCNELNFRNCQKNRFFEMSGDKNTRHFIWKQMEGDFNMKGHSHGDRRESTQCEGAWYDPVCTRYDWAPAWDFDLQPRQTSGMLMTGGYPTAQKAAWGWSLCNHMHFAALWN